MARLPTTSSGDPASPALVGDALDERVREILALIRPMIKADGGDIEYLDTTPAGIVRIRFMGACVGCPSSSMTLKMGIEHNLLEHVPGVRGVEAVDL